MSLYEGAITLRVRFRADNGQSADEWLRDIALEIKDAANEDADMDDDGDPEPESSTYVVASATADRARRV
jgi:hypothetical protein